MNNCYFRIEYQANGNIGSGFLYPYHESVIYCALFTARHNFKGDKDTSLIIPGDITISNNQFSLTLESDCIVLVGEDNEQSDVAIILIPKTKIPEAITDVKICAVIEGADCSITGTSRATDSEYFRTLHACKVLADKDYANQIQIEVADLLFSRNENAEILALGYSGSGAFIHVNGDIFVFGLVSKFEKPFQRLLCTSLDCASEILSKNNYPVLKKHPIETDNSIRDDIAHLNLHTEVVLTKIRNTIGGTHIPRDNERHTLTEVLSQSKNVLVSGPAGSGKSALVKDVLLEYGSGRGLFAFKGDELDRPSCKELFSSLDLANDLDTVLDSPIMSPRKIILIDSIEKILEGRHIETALDIIALLDKRKDVQLVFTSRSYASEFIKMRLSGIITFASYNITGLNSEELTRISETYPYLKTLLSKSSLLSMISIPFYLDRIIQTGGDIFQDSIETEQQLRDTLWRYTIKGYPHTHDLAMQHKRSMVFSQIAIRRSEAMSAFIPFEEELEIVQALLKDDVLVADKNREQFAPSHDILEDWALTRFIQTKSNTWETQKTNITNFYTDLGTTPAIRRAFRIWLKENIDAQEDVKQFIVLSLAADISQYWKDEVILAILQANAGSEFLSDAKDLLFSNNYELFSRYVLLLRVACQKVDYDQMQFVNQSSGEEYSPNYFLKPSGLEWGTLINFVFTHQDIIKHNIPAITNLILDWGKGVYDQMQFVNQSSGNDMPDPSTAKCAGSILVQLFFIQIENNDSFFREKDMIRLLLKFPSVIPSEITSILDWAINFKKENRDMHRQEHIKSLLFKELLSWEYGKAASHYCHAKVIEIAKSEWFAEVEPLLFEMPQNDRKIRHQFLDRLKNIFKPYKTPKYSGPITGYLVPRRREIEEEYGVTDNHDYSYFAASALRTPISHLLLYHPWETIDFIIELFNHSLDALIKSERFKDYLIDVRVNDGITQTGNQDLWNMYRGHTVAPYLLQSVLMALEKRLLEWSEMASKDDAFPQFKANLYRIYDLLLHKSKNVSITGVLASIVCANPIFWKDKAIGLLKVREFIQWDLHRVSSEFRSQPLWNDEPYLRKERHTANTLPHRKKHIETIAVDLAAAGFGNEIYPIIDHFQADADPNDDTWNIALSRMDFRTYKIIEKSGNQLLFQSQPKETIRVQAEEHQKMFNKQTSLLSSSNRLREAYENKIRLTIDEWTEHYNVQQAHGISLYSAQGTLAAIGIRDIWDHLDSGMQQWCIDLTFNTISANLYKTWDDFTNTNFSILDLKPALSVLPALYLCCDEENKIPLKKLIYHTLFAPYSISDDDKQGFKDAFMHELFPKDPDFALCCIWNAISSKGDLTKNQDETITRLANNSYEINVDAIDTQSIYAIAEILPLIPPHLEDVNIYHLLNKTVDVIFEEIQREESDYRSQVIPYETESKICYVIANFLLHQQDSVQRTFTERILNKVYNLNTSHSFHRDARIDFMNQIFSWLIRITIYDLAHKDSFWNVWNTVFSFSKENHTKIFANALLFQPKDHFDSYPENWELLKDRRPIIKSFVEFSELPRETFILLFKIGYNETMPEGLLWLKRFDNFSSVTDENSVRAWENLMQKLYSNPEKRKIIKGNRELREVFIQYLDKLIEKGSSMSFIIRDDFFSR